MAGATVETIVKGGLGKADVLVVNLGQGPMIVKDFAHGVWWLRWLGALQAARETSAYRKLEGVPGVPRFIGRIDRLAFAIERIDGERLAFLRHTEDSGIRHLAALRAIVDAIHARGVVHNDLRGRENVLLARDGSLAVIDFAAALLKWKGILAPSTYTDADRAALARFQRLRALWPFNAKRRPPVSA